ncbi:PepSY domain-containing protein [Candidatus Enterococcus leclercqii]|uniref:PepSY domain-containing protein n=1 Tax=Candidatus Enterococcus leclercqii TaxID=1857218 RepID=UPI0013796C15|nr:PepSY domain-containing protein [Enterococcus sp. CU9D]KAF1293573.1 hypothetical protein BAU14_02360 [Enterococcus sp. CU9D]
MKKTLILILGATILLGAAGCSDNKTTGSSQSDSVAASTAEGVTVATSSAATDQEDTTASVASSSASSDSSQMTSKDTAVSEVLDQKVDYTQAVAKFRELYPAAAIHELEWEAQGLYQGQKTKRFKIEGEDAKGEYEVTIDAVADTVHHQSDLEDDGDNDDWQEDQLPIDEVITMEAAAEVADKYGAEGYSLVKIELDEDDGYVIWSVKFNKDRHWQDVKIDAKTGEYLRTVADDHD